MATIKDVARTAGVAPASVTRVLGNHPNVSDVLRAKVLAAVQEVGYKPDLVAAGLRRGYTSTIGVIVSDILNPMLAELVDVIEVQLRASGYGVLLANSHGDPERDLESVGLLQQRRIDGLILSVADETRPDLIRALQGLTVPVVLVDRQVEGYNDAGSVLCDHRGGAKSVAQHFVDEGHERIAMISGPTVAYPSRERVLGMQHVLRDNGIEPVAEYFLSERGTERFGRQAIARLLDLPVPPTAVAVGNTPALVGVLGELQRRGVSLGSDLALATCDDVPVASFHSPAITAVYRDVGEVGRQAAAQLMAVLGDRKRQPRTIILPTQLQVRSSSRRARTEEVRPRQVPA